jgi:hypothetical protein
MQFIDWKLLVNMSTMLTTTPVLGMPGTHLHSSKVVFRVNVPLCAETSLNPAFAGFQEHTGSFPKPAMASFS